MKSQFIKAVEEILQKDGLHYIDPRKVGYRIKYPFMLATNKQMKAIGKLPNVIKCDNIMSNRPGYGYYDAFCIWVNIRPSNIL